jgi:hypothetical protein
LVEEQEEDEGILRRFLAVVNKNKSHRPTFSESGRTRLYVEFQRQRGRCQMNSTHSKTHSSEAQHTTDHDVIRKWAEERGGKPATVKATEENGHAGILRIDFDPPDEGLDRISWDEFFEKFDDAGIAFLHQDRTKDGELSRFHKFVRA